MKLTGEQRIGASRERVWAALNDPEVLRQCIPGCQSLEREGDDRFRASATIKVGPISARFSGTVTLSDIEAPNGYTISGQGDGGASGFAKGAARVRLADDDGATVLTYEVDAQVGGRLAQLGGPVIDSTAKQLAGNFFSRFGKLVAPPADQAAPAASTTVHPEAPAPAPASASPTAASRPSFPSAAVLAVVVAALAGFLAGRAQGGDAVSYFMALSVVLLLAIAATAGFVLGRRKDR